MAGIILSFIALAALPITAYLTMRRFDQSTYDRQRRTYRLNFPNQLTEEQVVAWLRAINGTMRGKGSVPTLAFETWATSSGIQHRIKVPWQQADFIVGQLRSLVPGMRLTPEEEHPHRQWTRAVEIGLSNRSRPLRIYDASNVAASMLSALQPLKNDETVVVQWVVSPARPERLPVHHEARTDKPTARNLYRGTEAGRDEINERRAKLAEPNVLAILRVAAVSTTTGNADHLIDRVRSTLSATRSAATKFVKRPGLLKGIQRRIDDVATPLNFPMQLSVPEFAALMTWPIGEPMVPGMPPVVGKQYPPNDNIQREGIVIGTSTFSGAERPIALGYQEALMHTWIGGSTGVGKSAVMANIGRQVMEDGYGLIVIEQAGDLYQSVLDYVPKHRIDDVVLLDVSDYEHPVGFNVLDQGNPLVVIDQIIDLFNHKYQKSMWAEEYIWHGLRTIAATPGLSFTDLPTLLVPKSDEVQWADSVQRAVKDPELRRWWQRQDNRDRTQQQQRADPVLSRVWQLASRPELRLIMGQSRSTFQVADVLQNNKILLVNLKGVSKETASLAGTLMMNAIWQQAKHVQKDKPTYVLLDEFADFMDLPVDTETMLAQARKHKVGMIMANQHLGQLPQSMREAVLANARSKIVLATNADDARVLSREMGHGTDVVDFTTLQQYEAQAQLLTPFGVGSPVTIRTMAPAYPKGNASTARARSRSKYGRPRAEVYAEIEQRHRADAVRSDQPRPTIGGSPDG